MLNSAAINVYAYFVFQYTFDIISKNVQRKTKRSSSAFTFSGNYVLVQQKRNVVVQRVFFSELRRSTRKT